MRHITILVLFAIVAAGACGAAPIVWESFEPRLMSPPWYKYPYSGHLLETDERHVHSGEHSALAQPNWRYSYTAYRQLPAAYDGDVHWSVWVLDDAVISPGMPAAPDDPLWTEEHVPHALIRLEDSGGLEFLHLGVIGRNKRVIDPQWKDNIFFSVNTAREGVKILSGPAVSPVPVRREPGWRKWTIRVKPYTGLKGDVEFYVDGRLVYRGLRATGPTGAVAVDVAGLGALPWTREWYWYDDCEFDYWRSPYEVSGVAEALSYPDGEWVRMSNVSVIDCFPDTITVADGSGGAIDVHPARFEAPDDILNITGRLATAPSGPRYIDSIVIEPITSASVVDVSSISEARALPDGTRVRIPERIVTASLGPVRFIQEDDRSCGLKIRNIYEPLIGDRIVVEGQMMTVGPEKLLEAEKVTIVSRGQPLPKPFGIANRSLYPPFTIPEGMLVATTGKVVRIPSTTWPGWVEIRDDSQPAAAPPVRVQLADYTVCPKLGDYVWVAGAAGWLVETVGSRPRIYCRYLSDTRVIRPAN